MKQRLNYTQDAPEALKALLALENYSSKQSGLEPRIIHLLKLRASQINGCAYCVDMHSKEARHSGLSPQWINMVSVWRESPVFDARERAVLEWTEALTNLPASMAPDSAFEPLKAFFTNAQIVNLTVAIGTINIWNRIAVGFRLQHPVDVETRAA
ncbi:carboxymuconolactone decarboxylase family protein [Methylovirgula sp. 4M-Z18]|uniref:carboxymuconolactone decarboxylase family protein n=1 Tax=Methylovirgula sp. 4M-Z18 TaxID=2293567 RepID=UPI000E2FC155|nr:carboxymuconolactone decarboxylase family protein [Methylovirgula sp. 4M-Z18]RFB78702.1 carboxymuconolactone decarboxylase family protein [Methylovirgula sp. 4M-Z18]